MYDRSETLLAIANDLNNANLIRKRLYADHKSLWVLIMYDSSIPENDRQYDICAITSHSGAQISIKEQKLIGETLRRMQDDCEFDDDAVVISDDNLSHETKETNHHDNLNTVKL